MLKDSQYPKFVFYSPGDLYEAMNIDVLYLQISKEVNLTIYQHELIVDNNGITIMFQAQVIVAYSTQINKTCL